MSAPMADITIRISPHARQRIKEMGLTDHKVKDAIADAEYSYPSERTRHRANLPRRVYVKDPIAVVVAEHVNGNLDVCTVLWNRPEERVDR